MLFADCFRCVCFTAHDFSYATEPLDHFLPAELLWLRVAGVRFHLQAHELAQLQADVLLRDRDRSNADQIGGSRCEASVKRAGLADDHVAGVNRDGGCSCDPFGTTGPRRSHIISEKSQVGALSKRESNFLLDYLLAHDQAPIRENRSNCAGFGVTGSGASSESGICLQWMRASAILK